MQARNLPSGIAMRSETASKRIGKKPTVGIGAPQNKAMQKRNSTLQNVLHRV